MLLKHVSDGWKERLRFYRGRKESQILSVSLCRSRLNTQRLGAAGYILEHYTPYYFLPLTTESSALELFNGEII